MKKIGIAICVASLIGFTACKEKASNKIDTSKVEVAADRDVAAKNLPVMTFEKQEHDFGTIEQGVPQETSFKFTNTGSAPLIITNATSSCGCTIPEYPKNTPIAPGDSGEMVVKFNGSGQNQVTKSITVTANTEKGTEMLRIMAFVNAKEGNSSAALGPVKQ